MVDTDLDLDAEGFGEDGEEDDGPIAEVSPKGSKKSRKERVLLDSSMALEKISAQLCADNHVVRFKQTSWVEKRMNSLRKWGRSSGCFEGGDKQLAMVSQQCFNVADAIEYRQQFLYGAWEKCFAKASEILSEKLKPIVLELSAANLCNFILQGTGRISDKALNDTAVAQLMLRCFMFDDDFLDGLFC